MVERLAIAVSFAIVVLTASVVAQTEATGPLRRAVIESLQDSQWVRLSTAELGRRQGRLLSNSPSELVLSPVPEPLRIPAARVDTLWTRGTSTKEGALIGALLGLGLLWLGSLGIGSMGGGLIRALVGIAIPRWKRQYP